MSCMIRSQALPFIGLLVARRGSAENFEKGSSTVSSTIMCEPQACASQRTLA